MYAKRIVNLTNQLISILHHFQEKHNDLKNLINLDHKIERRNELLVQVLINLINNKLCTQRIFIPIGLAHINEKFKQNLSKYKYQIFNLKH